MGPDMAVSAVDTRSAVPAAAVRFGEKAVDPGVPSRISKAAPSSSEVIRRVSDLLDLSPRSEAAQLPVVTFEDASSREYLNVTAKLLKAGNEQASDGYGPDGRPANADAPAPRIDIRA